VRRVLRDDGTLWLNLDSAQASSRIPSSYVFKPKDLIPLPWMVAMALQADGWYLRSAVVWAKGLSFCDAYAGSVMPESVKDRPTHSYEMIFLLTKKGHYYYNRIDTQEEGVYPKGTKAAKGSKTRRDAPGVNARPTEYAVYSGSRNWRDVWVIPIRPNPERHLATFPVELPERCIIAGTSLHACRECGAPFERLDDAWQATCGHPARSPGRCVVLDPFAGTGTTGLAAKRLGRDAILIDTSEEYCSIMRKRLQKPTSKSLFGA